MAVELKSKLADPLYSGCVLHPGTHLVVECPENIVPEPLRNVKKCVRTKEKSVHIWEWDREFCECGRLHRDGI